MAQTRPIISFSVGVVSRFMRNPAKHHFWAAKRISNMRLYRFIGSDWAGSLDDRKSTSENIFSLGSGRNSMDFKKPSYNNIVIFGDNMWLQLPQLVNPFFPWLFHIVCCLY